MGVMLSDATPLASVGAMLGEGPLWDERDDCLWFVDIKGPRVWRLDPANGRLDGWDAPDQIGWVLPVEGGGFLGGLAGGLHRFDPAHGGFDLHQAVDGERIGNRLNDAAVDPAGRVWFGSMDNGELEPSGRLYCLDRGIVRDSGADAVVITNGPAISPDGDLLYAVDTLGGRIDAYPVDGAGALGTPRPFLSFDPAAGHPDGAICDAAGGVWVGFFGGWAARRFDPDGTQTHEIRFPVANVTKVAIGGPDGRTAYATTARLGLTAEDLARQPLAGDVFSFAVDVPGVPVRPITLAR